MRDSEVAGKLRELADLLEVKDVDWKPRAYRTAARKLEKTPEAVEELAEQERLTDLEGIGESIAGKITEYLETGKIEKLQQLKKEADFNIEAFTAIEGIGPKTAFKLHRGLKVKDLNGLEAAAEKGKIRELDGFGVKTEERILERIDAARKSRQRTLLGKILQPAENLREQIKGLEGVGDVELVGSFRRARPTVGDLDLLVEAEDRERARASIEGYATDIIASGPEKISFHGPSGLQVDVRLVDAESWGSALIYFTGSKEHNIALRDEARDQGFKLNEYGLYRGETRVAGATEAEVYQELGAEFIPPEMRENTGEIESALEHRLPEPVQASDLRGDLQMHTDYSDGENTVLEMAEAAESRGLEYIALTDHGPSLKVAEGPLTVEELREQREELRKAEEETGMTVFHGMEVNVSEDGGLDVSGEMVKELDLVVAAAHSLNTGKKQALIKAFEDQQVDIWAHPADRMVQGREGLTGDGFEEVVDAAVDNDVVLEINGQPERLDLPWEHVKRYREQAFFSVSSDAHSTGELSYLDLGVLQARRGWLEKERVVNGFEEEKFREFFGI